MAQTKIDGSEPRSWSIVAREKKETQLERIPSHWRLSQAYIDDCLRSSDLRPRIEDCELFSTSDLEITNTLSIAALWSKIHTKEYTVLQVVTSFCKRAAVAHQITNCLTEIFFEEAMQRARELDAGPHQGAWHGIPISLKDQFNVIGQDSSIGYVSGAGIPATENSTVVDLILRQGGIVFCKTNVPQTVMTGDTVNNLFGRTLNPVNKNIIPSGSSGGEAALLACRGSIIGIGTDTGGSIRNPCAACSLYGLKPSLGRVSYKDVVNSNDGNPCVISVAGPMTGSFGNLEYFMRHTLSCEPWKLDHEVLRMPWQPKNLDARGLRIGVMLDHGDFPAHKCFYRILKTLSERLADVGVTVIKWESEELSRLHKQIADVLARTCLMDGGADIARQTSITGEPLILPGFVDDKFLLSIPQVWHVNKEARTLRNRYLELWQAADLDAIICPTNTFAFLTKDEYTNKGPEVGYTGMFNMLDYSVTNFPAGVVLKEELTEQQLAIGLEGFGVGCQVACGRLEEEKVLAITRICVDLSM